jgi:hypothetical protein
MAPERSQRQRPIRLLHQLDGLLSQALEPARSTGVRQRRQRQRQALAQRLLEPLPPVLAPTPGMDQLVWRALRWGGLALLLAVWLRR